MGRIFGFWRVAVMCVGAFVVAVTSGVGGRQVSPDVAVDDDDIGGVVATTSGAEAGVWVIAETRDLPTVFRRIVVTDDASTDRTAEIIREFHDPRIDLVVLDKNLGAVVALNASIRRSRGEFLCYLATDDFFLPGKIEKQVRYLKENPHVGAVFGMPKRIDQRGDRMPSDPLFSIPSWSSNFSRRKWLRQFFFHGNSLCHPTAMVRRSVYDQVGLFDARLWQLPDLDLWVRICAKFEIDILADELTAFRVLDGAQNVSAPRADSVLRTAFEFFQILKHYKYLTPDFAREIFGEDRVSVTPRLADAIEAAATLAEAGEAFGDPLGSGAVLVTGSVVTVGEARAILVREPKR